MTMLSNMPGHRPATLPSRIPGTSLSARFRRFIDRLVAAAIERHQRHAELVALSRFGDRELKDIGIYRGEIEHGLDEAAKIRAQLQRLDRG
jgi:uncharacterized protein YjiS (DUF1127 family)